MPSLRHAPSVLALALSLAAPAGAQIVAQGGFETPHIGTNTLQYNPPGSAWIFSGGSGLVNGPSSAFNTPGAAPEGSQVAFLQNPLTFSPTVQISQVITLPTAGQYTLSYYVAGRNNFGCCQGNTIYDFVLDATEIATGVTTTGMGYVQRTATFTSLAGPHVLAIQFDATTPGGDNTAFFDAVTISPVASAVPEPGSVALVATGLLGLVGVARRRRAA